MQRRGRARAPAGGHAGTRARPRRTTAGGPVAQRLLTLQHEAGNQAVQRVVAPLSVQRACACGGTCERCAADSTETAAEAHVLGPLLVGVQRAPAGDAPPSAPLIVDDGAETAPGQMTRTQFLTTLRNRVTATAEAGFVGSTWTAADCPALGRWFGYYATKDAAHVERAARAYGRGAASTADAYIDAACRRVALSVGAFVLTGKIVGVPDELAGQDLSEGGDPSAVQVGEGAAPAGVQRRVEGESLPADGARLAKTMGVDPSAVRIHADHDAAGRADRLGARAFTIGNRISFAAGAYRPGTIAGDALLAHELAHAAQQSDAAGSPTIARAVDGDEPGSAFEAEADHSAFAAVARLWGGARDSLAAVPRLRGRVRMQRCRSSKPDFGSDYLIEGAASSADPHMLMFERNAAALDAGHLAKIKTTATAEKTNPLAIYGSASEDETGPNLLAERRMRAVDAKLGAEGHTAPRTATNKAADAVGTMDYRSVRRVEIQVGSVAVPVPPSAQEDCRVTPAKPCTAANTASLTAAVTAGTAMLNTAIGKLGPPDAATKALVRRLFLSGNMAATDAQIVAKATEVQGKLTDWRAHVGTVTGAANHRCVKTCDPGCENADAYNQGLGATAMKSFCASYFAKGAGEQAVTMVHECGHGTPSVDSDDIAYGGMRQLDTLTEAEALKNTDSYVVLVRNLVSPGSAQIGGSDTFPGMNAGEEAKARRAISWLEVWLNACDQQVSEAYTAATEAASAPGGWTASFGQRIMGIIALDFPGINTPTLGTRPTLEDRTRVAAIFDRYSKMITAIFEQSITVMKIPAGLAGWDSGPGSSVRVDATFFALTDRQRLEKLLRMIALATPGVSSSIVDHYVTLADHLRQVRSLGAPP